MTDEISYHERGAGIYPSVFIGIEPTEFQDKETGETISKWRWVFHDIDDDSSEGVIDALTSRSFRPRTNALRFFTGILGRDPKEGDKPADHYGKSVNVVYGPNQNGRLTITDVLPLKGAK